MQEYISTVTNKNSKDFIPKEDRIAVFDMDGTLCGEKAPIYCEWVMFVDRVNENPNYLKDEGIKKTYDLIQEAIKTGTIANELELLHAQNNPKLYKGMTLEEYDAYVKAFMKKPVEGFTNLTYGQAWFKPMIEVIDYLNKNDFTVYICSGTDRYMCRSLADGTLDIAPEHIIGMDVFVEASGQQGTDGLEYAYTASDSVVRTDQFLIKNVKANKVSQIAQEIGRKPVLAFGNSSGDTSMAMYVTSNNKYKSMAFMVVADDENREYGNAVKGKETSEKWTGMGFVPISMYNDWTTIYGDGVGK